jgi:hypothetical protein
VDVNSFSAAVMLPQSKERNDAAKKNVAMYFN